MIASWNGLMLRAVAAGARVFGREDYAALALANAHFLRRVLVRAGGRVMRATTAGVTKIPGFLEDHAAVALGFLAVYELTFDRAWLDEARAIAEAIDRWFWDEQAGAFFDTARDGEPLITRPRDITDNAMPSGTSLSVELYLHLAELLDDRPLRERATAVLDALAEPMAQHPGAFGHLLGAADLAVHGAVAVALVGDPASPAFRALAASVATRYVPSLVLAGGQPGRTTGIGLMDGRPQLEGAAAAYVCRHYVCEAPERDAEALGARLDAAARPPQRTHA